MRGISRTTSSHSLFVELESWMLNVAISCEPAPRPVPNSKRPSLRWSSIATRSALRTGWFTRGDRLKMPELRWMYDVRAAQYAMNTSLADVWLYSVSAWCSETQTYFQLFRSAHAM